MHFYMPTKVYSERGCVRRYSQEWATLGKKALIVTGKSSAKNGALMDVLGALHEHGTAVVVFDETEENPSIEMVMRVRELGLRENVDFVIGIGGGSPMDAAKAIALMLYHKEKGAEFLYQNGDDEALPVVEVPTTCGTGSEVTPYAILTIHAKRTKSSLPHRIYPAYALADGKYLLEAGRGILVNTAVDALGHFIESYINANATDYSHMLCEYGMKVWSSTKSVLIGAERTVEDCDRLLLASTPHGKAVGYFLPGYVAAADTAMRRKVLELIGFPDQAYFAAFIHRLLGPMQAEPELITRAVEGILANEAKLKNVPFSVTEDILNSICAEANLQRKFT